MVTCQWMLAKLGHHLSDCVAENLAYRTFSISSSKTSSSLVWMCTSRGLMSVDISAPVDLLAPIPCFLDHLQSVWDFSFDERTHAFSLSQLLSTYYAQSSTDMLEYRAQHKTPADCTKALRYTTKKTCAPGYTPMFTLNSMYNNYAIRMEKHSYYIHARTSSLVKLPFELKTNSVMSLDGSVFTIQNNVLTAIVFSPFSPEYTILTTCIPADTSFIQADPSNRSSVFVGNVDEQVYRVSVLVNLTEVKSV